VFQGTSPEFEESERNHRKPLWEQKVPWLRFKPCLCPVQVQTVAITSDYFTIYIRFEVFTVVAMKRQFTQELHGATSQKAAFFMLHDMFKKNPLLVLYTLGLLKDLILCILISFDSKNHYTNFMCQIMMTYSLSYVLKYKITSGLLSDFCMIIYLTVMN
jgi:hypothetical protein